MPATGNFRADSPLFSSLELSDGPLNVYELQRLSRAPELIVLSGCDLAVSETRPGDELLGFAAALIGMGSRTVIASVVPVPDAATKRLMIALHELLRAGDRRRPRGQSAGGARPQKRSTCRLHLPRDRLKERSPRPAGRGLSLKRPCNRSLRVRNASSGAFGRGLFDGSA